MSLLDDLIKSKRIKSYLKYVNIIEENSDEIRLLDVLKNESKSMTLNEKDYLVKKIFELVVSVIFDSISNMIASSNPLRSASCFARVQI